MTSSSSIDLRLGRWEEVLADVECDALIVDAPYSARTHGGHDSQRVATHSRSQHGEPLERRKLNYEAWSPADVAAFVAHWAPRTRGWIVSLTDDTLAPAWRDAMEAAGRYVFAPLACVEPGSRVRMAGDGPAQWSVWTVVSRPRTLSRWGALPGAYVIPNGQGETRGSREVVGGKPLWLMRALVRDYSRHGDVVCDPCAGGGTTLLAAGMERRRAVGAEALPQNHALAAARLGRGFTATMFD